MTNGPSHTCYRNKDTHQAASCSQWKMSALESREEWRGYRGLQGDRTEHRPSVAAVALCNTDFLAYEKWVCSKSYAPSLHQVTYTGFRDYQRSFHDKGKQFLSSKADQLKLCLNLLPVTNYSISITAQSARFTATITTNTSLPGTKCVITGRHFWHLSSILSIVQ